MKNPAQLINAIPSVRTSRNRSAWRRGFLLIPLSLVSIALSPQARASCQEGCLTSDNTALGDDTLVNNTTGYSNTAIGSLALSANILGFENTAIGRTALNQNTTGGWNTAIGVGALFSNTAGDRNTASGDGALAGNTWGTNNTASGYFALGANTTSNSNTATGAFTLFQNTTGNSNTATGEEALNANTTGNHNVALGRGALSRSTTASNNTAIGDSAGTNLTTGGNNIDIGNAGVSAEAHTVRIGTVGKQTNTYIAGISGVAVAGGMGVIVDTNGHLGTVVSSERFKDAIKPMDKASEALLSLKPVTFRYKKELDPRGVPQFGLVAEQVAKVDPDLVVRDEEAKPYTVRYEAVNAMLLNEFLKEHRKVDEQSSQLAEQDCKVQKLEATVAQLEATLKTQSAQIQKVSDQLEASKSSPKIVAETQ